MKRRLPLIPPAFEYASPRSVSEAVELLRLRGDGAKVLAGGQSLIPLLKLRLAAPTVLVDINRIPGLDYIREKNGVLSIGALVRTADLEASSLMRKRYPAIHDASEVIADPLVRNLGTVGGNLSHGDPANDLPAVLLALGGKIVATGPTGDRVVAAESFFVDSFTTVLSHEEILTEVRVPSPGARSGGAYLKHELKVGDFATAAVAVQLSLGANGECEKVGIGLTAVGPTAIKAKEAEGALLGRKPGDPEAVKTAARLAAEASDPASDIRGTAEYKKGVIGFLLANALQRATERARSRGGA
jgi:carbon-monoxide dehydrogenase medium subunit